MDARVGLPSDWEYRQYVCLPDEFYEPPHSGELIVDVAREPEGPYYQALPYIEHVAHLLPKLFGPSEWAVERLRARETAVLPNPRPDHVTACHVRRTDYLENPDRFPQLTDRYFQEALRQVGETSVLVFSDDPAWCEQNLDWFTTPNVQKVDVVGGHVRPIPPRARADAGLPDDILDLWVMAGCDAHIIANSSFSWWGAFLSEKRNVFYPDRWFGADAQHSDRMWEAFPDDWVQVEC